MAAPIRTVSEASIGDAGEGTRMMAETATVDQVLYDALRYREVLGAVAVSCEGLVVGCAGVGSADADLVGALGASLIGAADRTARRLGAGQANDVSLNTSEGMIHVRRGPEFAVLLFTERCDAGAASAICGRALDRISAILAAS